MPTFNSFMPTFNSFMPTFNSFMPAFNSKTNKKKNLNEAMLLADKAIVADKPDLIAFPEMMAFYGGTDEDKKSSAEDIPDGETTQQLSTLAKTNKIFVFINKLEFDMSYICPEVKNHKIQIFTPLVGMLARMPEFSKISIGQIGKSGRNSADLILVCLKLEKRPLGGSNAPYYVRRR